MYRVNFLPDNLQNKDINRSRRLIVIASFAFLFLIILGYGIFYYELISMERQLVEHQKELTFLRPKVEELEEIRKDTNIKQDNYQDLIGILQNRLHWYKILGEIPLNLPVDTWINRLEIKAENITTKSSEESPSKMKPPNERKNKTQVEDRSLPVPNALYLYGSCWNMGSVGVFIDSLSKLSYFEDVSLLGADQDKEKGVIHFELAGRLKGGNQGAAENYTFNP